MAITDTLVLPSDVLLTPLTDLPRTLRRRLPHIDGGLVLGRARVRASSKVVSGDAADLLRRFQQPMRIADAVLLHSEGGDPRELLDATFALLHDCYEARFLVPATSPDAGQIVPSLERGEHVAGHVILDAAMVLEDTEVYQARDPRGRIAAVKLARIGAEARMRKVLRHERRALLQVGGRGAPRLRSAGTFEGRPFLVMQWSAGISPQVQAQELRNAGDRTALLRLLVAIARAYARLHERGVLHGDVHAGNLLVSVRGRITLLDFGFSSAAGHQAGGRGAVLPFADPELARAMLTGARLPALTAAGEQYAVAALLYALAAGAPHIGTARDQEVVLAALADGTRRSFASQGVAAWPELERVLARALTRASGGRFPSMRAFAGALARCSVPRAISTPKRLAGTPTDAWLADLARRPAREWADAFRPPRASVMHGVAGTVFGMYRLASLRDDPQLLASATGWWEHAARLAERPGAFVSRHPGPGASASAAISPYFGHAGLIVVEAHIAHASGQLARMSDCVARYCAIDVPARASIELASGVAGVLLGAALLLEAAPPTLVAARSQLVAVGNQLERRLVRALEGLHLFPSDGPLDNAGIAHGWGGVLYALLHWCQLTGTSPSAQLERGMVLLARLAEPCGRGVRFPRVPGRGSDRDIPGWCNGPAGLVHLWNAAHHLTGEVRYAALAQQCGWTAWEATDRFPDLCCGLAGRAYALLALHRVTGDAGWLARARELARRVGAPFPRTTAGHLSLYKGALGAALLAQDLESPTRSCHPFFEAEGWPGPGLAIHG